jgi:hypothetical protein
MNINNISPRIAGATLVFAGSMLMYFEGYKNNEIISALAYLTVFSGWIVLFIQVIKGTPLEYKNKNDTLSNPEPFKQRATRLLASLVLVGVMVGNIYFALHLGRIRKTNILDKQPAQTTIAEVTGIQVVHGRSSTTFYAIFQYTAGNKPIRHRWAENGEGEFLVGQKFEIKYSVEYPEMFKILNSVP